MRLEALRGGIAVRAVVGAVPLGGSGERIRGCSTSRTAATVVSEAVSVEASWQEPTAISMRMARIAAATTRFGEIAWESETEGRLDDPRVRVTPLD